jgi:hypothetical protein
LVNEVTGQAGQQLSPEAVGLLRFNIEYLISKLHWQTMERASTGADFGQILGERYAWPVTPACL